MKAPRLSAIVRPGCFRSIVVAVLIVFTPLPLHLVGFSTRAYARNPQPGEEDPTLACDVPPPCSCNSDPVAQAASTAESPTTSAQPVNFISGTATEMEVDLRLPGPGTEWAFYRSYDSGWVLDNSGFGSVVTALGERWMSGARGPYLVLQDPSVTPSSTTPIQLTASASSNRKFGYKSGSGWFEPNDDYNAIIVYNDNGTTSDKSDDTYELTEYDSGQVLVFHALDSQISWFKRGRLLERTTRAARAAGETGFTYHYNGNGYVSFIVPPSPQDTAGYQINFYYNTGGLEIGRLERVDIVKGRDVLGRADYTYRGNNASYDGDTGTTGDLVQVKVSHRSSDGALDITRYTQYRYYPTGHSDGKPHQLKMVLESDAVQRAIDKGLTDQNSDSVVDANDLLFLSDTDTIGGTELKDFASRSFTYYTSDLDTADPTECLTAFSPTNGENFSTQYGGTNIDESKHLFHASAPGTDPSVGLVKSERINGACASCSGGSTSGGVEKQYYYAKVRGWVDHDAEEVGHLIIEDTIDADGTPRYRTIAGTNFNGVAIRVAVLTAPLGLNANNIWCRSKVFGDRYSTSSSGGKTGWRLLEYRQPSAHRWDSTDEDKGVHDQTTLKQFLNPVQDTTHTNDALTVRTNAGVVYYFDYDANGYPKDITVRQGAGTSNRNYVRAFDWTKAGTGQAATFTLTKVYDYPVKTANRADSTRQTTSLDVQYWSDNGDKSPQVVTVTRENIGGNNPSVDPSFSTYYDELGRKRWTKDADGFIDYFSYHPNTGGLAYVARDVDPASLPSDADSNSTKWVTSTAYGADSIEPSRDFTDPAELELVTRLEYDPEGRLIKETTPADRVHYTAYDGDKVVRFPYWDATNSKSLMPIEVYETDAGGTPLKQYELQIGYSGTALDGGVPVGLGTSIPAIAAYVSFAFYGSDPVNGQRLYVDRYHKISTSQKYRTSWLYDALGMQGAEIQEVASGKYQVTATLYDTLGRPVERRRGVATTAPTSYATVSGSSPGFPLLADVELDYDGGSVGDGRITRVRRYHTYTTAGSTDTLDKYTEYLPKYTFRGHLRSVERQFGSGTTTSLVTPVGVRDLDWLGRPVRTAIYSTFSDWSTLTADEGYTDYIVAHNTNRHNVVEYSYDKANQLYRTKTYPGQQSTLASRFELNHYYDLRGNRVASGRTNEAIAEFAYDGIGRHYQTRVVQALSGTLYNATTGAFQYVAPIPKPDFTAMSGGDGGVIHLMHNELNTASRVEAYHRVDSNHNDANGFALASTTGKPTGGVRYTTLRWFDGADRVTTSAYYGSGTHASGAGKWQAGNVPTPSSEPSAASDNYLATAITYDSATGREDERAVLAGKSTKFAYDDLGRRISTTENYTTSSPANADESRITSWTLNGLNKIVSLKAWPIAAGGGTVQETEYLYYDDYDASLARLVKYPDGTKLIGGGQDNVQLSYNLDGSIASRLDQRGVLINYHYNARRQIAAQAVDLSGVVSGQNVDSAVLSITSLFDGLGRLQLATSHSSAVTDPSSTTGVVNQVRYIYNDTTGYGQLVKSEQDHAGVVTGTEPSVQYAYDATASGGIFTNSLRLQSVTYPTTSRTIYQGYGAADSVSDLLARVAELRETNSSGTQLTTYDYAGVQRLVGAYYPAAGGFGLTHYQHESTDPTDAFQGYDRFGRVEDQRWRDWSPDKLYDHQSYDYDSSSNRTARDERIDLINSKNGTSYADQRDYQYNYDQLNRVTSSTRGQISGSTISNVESRYWSLDQLGNWEKLDDATPIASPYLQDRTHNEVNEISTFATSSGSNNPAYDRAGNITTMPQPANLIASYAVKYDAWNRMVEVKAGSTVIQTNEYDGLHRRIVRDDTGGGGDLRHFYYNTQWQCLEERIGSSTTADKQYVWHPYYIDALATSYESSGRRHYLHDANMNVTAVTDSSGSVIERYSYSAYGQATVLAADFSVKTSGFAGNEFRFTGRRIDEATGLQYSRFRIYHLGLGRWSNRDPIGYAARDVNLYGYVGGMPTRYRDPLGLAFISLPPEDGGGGVVLPPVKPPIDLPPLPPLPPGIGIVGPPMLGGVPGLVVPGIIGGVPRFDPGMIQDPGMFDPHRQPGQPPFPINPPPPDPNNFLRNPSTFTLACQAIFCFRILRWLNPGMVFPDAGGGPGGGPGAGPGGGPGAGPGAGVEDVAPHEMRSPFDRSLIGPETLEDRKLEQPLWPLPGGGGFPPGFDPGPGWDWPPGGP